MKKLIKSALAIALLTVSSMSFAGEIYESALAKCKITFPGEYEAETEKGDETTSITVTASQGGMLYMLIATIYEEPVEEDDNDLTEVATLMNVANAFNSKKLKADKNVFSFNVSGQKGFFANINGKLDKNKLFGNYYVICIDNILYQFTALSNKKGYDERAANKFSDSFGVE